MKGADEYYNLFNGDSQQIGRLFLRFHTHARGKCFEMYLLPEGEKNDSATSRVEIYGMTGGQRGWTESYGWLHKGKWQEDFYKIVEEKKAGKASAKLEAEKRKKESDAQRKDYVDNLLSDY